MWATAVYEFLLYNRASEEAAQFKQTHHHGILRYDHNIILLEMFDDLNKLELQESPERLNEFIPIYDQMVSRAAVCCHKRRLQTRAWLIAFAEDGQRALVCH